MSNDAKKCECGSSQGISSFDGTPFCAGDPASHWLILYEREKAALKRTTHERNEWKIRYDGCVANLVAVRAERDALRAEAANERKRADDLGERVSKMDAELVALRTETREARAERERADELVGALIDGRCPGAGGGCVDGGHVPHCPVEAKKLVEASFATLVSLAHDDMPILGRAGGVGEKALANAKNGLRALGAEP